MTNWKENIITDKGILLGKPVINGTRISVDHLLGLLAQGWSEKQILENFPRLTKDDLQAVFLNTDNPFHSKCRIGNISHSKNFWIAGRRFQAS